MAVLGHEGTKPIMYGPLGIPVGAEHRPGYLARPDRAGRFPTVVIVPDLDGLTSHEKDLCRSFARNGIAALALDLYRERTGDAVADYNRLEDRRALTDLDEVAEFLAGDGIDWSHAGALGVLGLDVGGRFALAVAASRRWVAAVAVCATPLAGDEDRQIQVADLLSHLPVPVLGLYGADDDLVDAASVDEAARRNEHGQWILYEGAGHSFFNIDSEDYHAAAAGDAEQRLIQFFLHSLPAADEEELGF